MNGKMIFLDIDGTLVSDLSAPSPLVKEAVRGTRKKGNKVFLCTGRNMPIIGREILEVGFDGVVASAGAHVEADGRILLDRILPEKTIQECLSVFHENGMYCRIETPEGIYTDPQMEALLKQTQAPDKFRADPYAERDRERNPHPSLCGISWTGRVQNLLYQYGYGSNRENKDLSSGQVPLRHFSLRRQHVLL